MTQYKIEETKAGIFYTASVTGTKNLDFSPPKKFTRLSSAKARQRAEKWCTLKDKKQANQAEVSRQARQNYFEPTLDSDTTN